MTGRRVNEISQDDAAITGVPAVPPMMGLASERPWGDSADIVDPDQIDNELQTVLSEIGQSGEEGFVVIYEIEPGSKKGAWLSRYSTSEFSALGVSGLGQKFGAGEFMIYVYGASRRLKARKLIKISARAVPLQKPDAPNIAPGLEALANAMKEGFTQMAAILSQQNKGPTETEILSRLKMYKELFGGQNSNGGVNTAFETMRTAMEFVKGLQPRKGEPGFLDAAMTFMEKFAPTITKAIETAAQAQSQSQAQPPVAPAQLQQAAIAPTAPIGAENMQFFQSSMIKAYLEMFIQSAQQGDDPATYANLILDKVPTQLVDEWLAKGDLISELAKLDQRIAQPGIREWFAELQVELMNARKEMDEQPADDGDNI